MFIHKFKIPDFCKREFPDCGINYRTICDYCFCINELEEENNRLQKKITELESLWDDHQVDYHGA
jgi:hypothetical protein